MPLFLFLFLFCIVFVFVFFMQRDLHRADGLQYLTESD